MSSCVATFLKDSYSRAVITTEIPGKELLPYYFCGRQSEMYIWHVIKYETNQFLSLRKPIMEYFRN